MRGRNPNTRDGTPLRESKKAKRKRKAHKKGSVVLLCWPHPHQSRPLGRPHRRRRRCVLGNVGAVGKQKKLVSRRTNSAPTHPRLVHTGGHCIALLEKRSEPYLYSVCLSSVGTCVPNYDWGGIHIGVKHHLFFLSCCCCCGTPHKYPSTYVSYLGGPPSRLACACALPGCPVVWVG